MKNTSKSYLSSNADMDRLDQWMRSLTLPEAGLGFTQEVVAAAMLAKKRQISRRILMGVLLFILMAGTLCVWAVQDGSSLQLSPDVLHLVSWLSFDLSIDWNGLSFTAFLILEGVLFLLMIEKVTSSYIELTQWKARKKKLTVENSDTQ
ncbi:hypothetical protein BFP72_11895 [Reichenbachiella sp. 5M10]|uniref:hypothetical protein n=1 Tax=Reichenbachiella sp. 5M10 TaxID=1889772 RepID=UPI000C1463A9|nr:hypothetical protein [Reichenbachiella sp. 5M10]PIB36046.1 hypothetical protein BFP72_11895 [Reichenbachiella sp. 5M10]